MKNPLISIVMPAYGVEKFIGEAIESVLSQDYGNWELIVVDDGTKDNSAEIAKFYAVKDSRVRVVSKSNGGLSDARNYGLNFVSGDYVHFFDSDDYIEQSYYSDLVSCLATDSPDVLISGFTTEHRDCNNSKIAQSVFKPQSSKDIPAKSLLKFVDFAWNKLFRRQFIIEKGLKYERGLYLIEDCEFMSRVLRLSPIIKVSDSAGYHYVNRPRITLSKAFDINTLSLVNRRIDYTRSILSHWGYDDETIKDVIELVKFSNIKFLFNLLFTSSETHKYNKIKEILNLSNLQNVDLSHTKLSLKDKLIYYSIRFRMTLLLQYVYSVKKYRITAPQDQNA